MFREKSGDRLTSKSFNERGDKCLLAITSASLTSLRGVDLRDRTEPTIPVAFGGERTRRGTLIKFMRGNILCFEGRNPAGAGLGGARRSLGDLLVAGGGARVAISES
jgi:hypothetical protein